LILELVSGGAPKKVGSFFSASDTDIPSANLRQFENFFNQLAFFPHILDYRGICIYLCNILRWSSFPSIRIVIHPVIHPSKFLIPEEEDDRRGGGRMAASAVYPNVYVIQSCRL
jgi:cytoplasmic FMR1 interacting protein